MRNYSNLKKASVFIFIPALLVAIGLGNPSFVSAQEGGSSHRHNGFYLRLSLGLMGGNLSRAVESDPENAGFLGYEADSDVGAGGSEFELSIGGTPGRGFVLAGTWIIASIADPAVSQDEDAREYEVDKVLVFNYLGLTLDYYFNEEKGFHLGGTLGFAGAFSNIVDGEEPFDTLGGAGFGGGLFTGYEWWVGREWSIGFLVRFMGAGIVGEMTEDIEDEEVTVKEDDSYFSGSLSFTATYH